MYKDDIVTAILRKHFDLVLFDLDGVIADFSTHAASLFGKTTNVIHGEGLAADLGVSEEAFCAAVKAEGDAFWETIPVLDYGYYVWKALAFHGQDWHVVTAPMKRNKHCAAGKTTWLWNNLGADSGDATITKQKHLLAQPNRLLIDDMPHNVEAFRKAGGNALLWRGENTELVWR